MRKPRLRPLVDASENGDGENHGTCYDDLFRAEALPPLRPAAFFCAVVPPCLELPPEPDFLPPRLEAPGELAIRAARSLDIPLSLRASYCRSFLTLGRLSGIVALLFMCTGSPQLAFLDASCCFNSGSTSSARNSRPLS